MNKSPHPTAISSIVCSGIFLAVDGLGGETGDLSTRHERHHRKPCFDKHGANCIGVLLEEGEQRRLDIETDIRNNGDAWPCNDQ